ncbi:hypothetical protein WMF33_06000 [Sorangium sp. So ce394]
MSRVDLVVAVGADHEQVAALRIRQEQREEPERGEIRPLQIVEEEDQRVLRRGEDAQEALKYKVEPVLGLGRPELGHGRLGADDELQLRQQVDEDLPALAEGGRELAPQARERLAALGEQVPRELPQRLRQRGVWDAPVELVELARDEARAAPGDRPVQLAHHRRLADAGVTGDQRELGGAPARPLPRREEHRDLRVSAIELLRDGQPVTAIVVTAHHR